MRLRPLLLVVAAGMLAPTAAAAPPTGLADLPGVEALRPVPPLAPPQPPVTEVPRLRGTVFSQERVLVGISPEGAATTVEVTQRLHIRALGDYAFVIPAPAVSVRAGPRSQSQPGFRPNQIVWQGFSPRRKVLSAVAELRNAGSVPALPARIRVTGAPVRPGPFQLVIRLENTTRTPAAAFTADAAQADIARARETLRSASRSNRPIEGSFVRIRGLTRPVTLHVSALLGLRGSVDFPAGAVEGLTPTHFTRRLDRGTLRVTVRGVARRAAVPRLRIVASPSVAAAIPPSSARTLRATILGYLRYARTQQYHTFLANPDPRGPSSATYVYDTAAAQRSAPQSEQRSSDDPAVPAAILLGGVALIGVALVVLWAHL